MSDKKNDDRYEEERERFIPASSASSNARRGAASLGLGDSFSRLNNSPLASVLAYCIASISMTVVNKFVVSGPDWNLTLLYLAIQVSTILVVSFLRGTFSLTQNLRISFVYPPLWLVSNLVLSLA